MTGCLAPIDKGGLDELIAKGRANPQAVKILKRTTIAEGRFRHLNMIRDLPPCIVDELLGLLGETPRRTPPRRRSPPSAPASPSASTPCAPRSLCRPTRRRARCAP